MISGEHGYHGNIFWGKIPKMAEIRCHGTRMNFLLLIP